jgi:hypothetical protein
MKIKTQLTLMSVLILNVYGYSWAIDEVDLPLTDITSFVYEGAFRLAPSTGSLDFSEGVIAYNPTNNSLFVAADIAKNQFLIGEYAIPEVLPIKDIYQLNASTDDIQAMTPIFATNSSFNTDRLDRITGMAVISGKLVVNAVRWYDASADNTQTTMVLDNANNIAASPKDEFLRLNGADHLAGWISEIPQQLKPQFGNSTYIFGNASNYSIDSRWSIGPSVFLVDENDLFSGGNAIPSVPVVDFNLTNYLSIDDPAVSHLPWDVYGYNTTSLTAFPDGRSEAAKDANGNVITIGNDLWTVVSTAAYGFMIPGTRTYAVIGTSGGHNGGLGYKLQREDRTCGGPCSYDKDDVYNYYWLWDINDYIKVLNGELLPHEVRPYQYGEFQVPFQFVRDTKEPQIWVIGGATFDKINSDLYVSIPGRGKVGNFDYPPLFLKYHIDVRLPNPPSDLSITSN